MSKNFKDFVDEKISELDGYNKDNLQSIQELIRYTIDFYHLKSYEEVEETEFKTIKVLHLHSIIEENLLSKIIEISLNGDSSLSVEAVYKGHVIRYY